MSRLSMEDCEYLVVGKEVGESGTPHLQGYVCLKSKKAFTWLKKRLPEAHLEVMKGSPQQAAVYCKKDGDFEEYGTLPAGQTAAARGERAARLKKAHDLACAGRLEEVEPGLKIAHLRNLQELARLHAPRPADLPPIALDVKYGLWLWGPAGSGKSRFARTKFSSTARPVFLKRPDEWWDGFPGTGVVLVEDLDLDHARPLRRNLKIWADMYMFNGNVKGSQVFCRPSCVIVTSQYPIDLMWEDLETREAMHRRFLSVTFPAESVSLTPNLEALSKEVLEAGTAGPALETSEVATVVLSPVASPSPTQAFAPAAVSSAAVTAPRLLVRGLAFCGRLPSSRGVPLRLDLGGRTSGEVLDMDSGSGVGTSRGV